MKGKSIISVFLLLGLTYGGCKKYEEGPRISLKSKKERVVNKWQYEEYLQYSICYFGPCSNDYADVTTYNQEYYVELFNDNTFLEFRKHGGPSSKTYEGEWKFIENKTAIEICYGGDCGTYVWEIKRLKEDELWIEEIAFGVVWSKRKLIPF